MQQVKATLYEFDAQQMRTKMLDYELKAQGSKMNPQFIFNSLNSIQELVLREDKARSYDCIVCQTRAQYLELFQYRFHSD
jgi:LytS/YehU family sensor histidine kinase